jgi:site-specific DNA-methyltransferase (adenine-specific)
MAIIPDNFFNLAIVDPPYFDGPQKKDYYKGTKKKTDIGNYKDLSATWDVPDEKYFKELFRVSKNQIIWGANYYKYNLSGGRIAWIKGDEKSPFSMIELAYQSFYNRIDGFKFLWSGFWKEKGWEKIQRIHPTEKPVELYKWLLKNYAKDGDKILDTHGGSGSICIACHDMGFDLDWCELDKDYYEAAKKRFDNHTSQLRMC